MIEVALTYDLLPNIDQDAYFQFLKKAIVLIFQQQGIIEIRAKRSMSGSPEVLIELNWETVADWNRFEIKKGMDNTHRGTEKVICAQYEVSSLGSVSDSA